MVSPDDAVLSIQSEVAYGHVGNSAAVLPLQRLGFEVFPVNTVQLAHHPGHGRWRGHKVSPEQLRDILTGLGERQAFGRCVALLSGYLGDAAMGELVLEALRAIKAERPEAVYLCDPVIGDDGPGVFVAPDIPEVMRDHLVPAADVITPNRFELELLAEQEVSTIDDALAAAAKIRAWGPDVVVVTGLVLPDRPDQLAVLAAADDVAWLVSTPRRPVVLGGMGDAFSALFLGHYLKACDVKAALELAVAAMFALIEQTHETGAEELRLVAAQDTFAAPPRRFCAERVR